MYQVKAYETNCYNREIMRAFRDERDLFKWATQFLADGGRKVIVTTRHKRHHFGALRNGYRRRGDPCCRRLWTWTSALEPQLLLRPWQVQQWERRRATADSLEDSRSVMPATAEVGTCHR